MPAGNPHGVVIADMTWDDVGRRIAGGVAGILPIGAAAKEHGHHLPMNTDAVQADILAAALARSLPALIWPVLSYGYYPAFAGYAGSISLGRETFIRVVAEIAADIVRHGARPLFILDTGISTIEPVDEALRRLADPRIVHLKPYAGPHYRSVAAQLAQQPWGSHADELETSRMLALAPDAVDLARAAPRCPPDRPMAAGALEPHDPSHANYSPAGVYGDPSLATVEKGRLLHAAMMADLIETAAAALRP